ncbi:hypothetical protein X739_28135 [Mesorhizobium sp. LNHC220B00]|nr:hypothetical protein X739_28135 [Mesorhizobium sp. LNHC220B00]
MFHRASSHPGGPRPVEAIAACGAATYLATTLYEKTWEAVRLHQEDVTRLERWYSPFRG